jgi:hypothetical protein
VVLNDSVIVGFLDPFVGDCAGQSGCHLGTEDGGHFGPDSGTDYVAAYFGEEYWDRVAGELGDTLGVT